MSVPAASLAYRFGAYRLVPAERALYADDRPVKLGARALDMLVALVERRDRVVSKDELLSLVWPGLVVEENNLQVQVVTLRKLLGHPAIATVPGRGYRFTMPLSVDGGEPATPPPAAPSSVRTAAGELIGRDADLAALLALHAEHPVVTLVGAGGIGKTRLARTAADRWAVDGRVSCWVDLAPLADPALLVPAVGRALGFPVDGAADAEAAVVEMLRQRPTRLLLDNAEHLVDAVAAFVERLCRDVPGQPIVVTSQELLRVTGEQVFRVPGLSLPADGADVADSGAAALFAARARAVDPGFRVGPANAAAVAEICRQLDGIPLAIELAAGRVSLLGVDGLRQRLHERFHVLTAGARVALRRHQTLRAALDWSHGLLAAPEQAVFRRLGCFVGGFTLEAAQAVAEDEHIDRWDVLEHLGSLVDKSLVLADGDGIPRYRMLETTRLFALERLADAGETDCLLARHAEAIAEQLSASGTEPMRWRVSREQFESDAAELDNARSALAWAAGAADGAASVRIASAVGMAFVRADQMNEYAARLVGLQRRVTSSLAVEDVGLFWLRLALAGVKSASAEAATAARRAIEVHRRLGDRHRLHESLACGLLIGANRADAEPATAAIDEARALEQAEWPPAQRSFLRWAEYRSLRRSGDEAKALEVALTQAELSAQRDPLFTLRLTGVNIVDCLIALGRLEEAEAVARDALRKLADAGVDDARVGAVHEGLALSLIEQGRWDEALPAARCAHWRLATDGDELRLLEPLARLASAQGRVDVAVQLLGHVDAALAADGLVRWPAAALRRKTTEGLLRERVDAARWRELAAAGASLARAGACKLAFDGHADAGLCSGSDRPQRPADASCGAGACGKA